MPTAPPRSHSTLHCSATQNSTTAVCCTTYSHIRHSPATDSKISQQEKSARKRRKHCVLAVVRRSQKFRPTADPFPGSAGWPKFNQLEMVTTFTYKPSLVRIDIPTHKYTPTNKQTGPITINCTAALLACSVTKYTCSQTV